MTTILRQAGFQGKFETMFNRKVGQYGGSSYYPSPLDPPDPDSLRLNGILLQQRLGSAFYPWTDRKLHLFAAIFGVLTVVLLFLSI